MIAGLKPIETIYRGNRFRSRLEARWAVFFTELGVKYEYEKEGFDLGEAGRYLPDFWLPEMELWVEVKAETPEYGGTERKKLSALRQASGKQTNFLIGQPIDCLNQWVYCVFCQKAWQRYLKPLCDHLEDIRYESHYLRPVVQAGLAAQQARFEYGENGAPPKREQLRLTKGRVYLAGKMNRIYCHDYTEEDCECIHLTSSRGDYEPSADCQECNGNGLKYTPTCDGGKGCRTYDWRSLVLGESGKVKPPARINGWTYVGPDCTADHCDGAHQIVSECLQQIRDADVVFCWMHREDVHGTMAELAWAQAFRKDVFVGLDANNRQACKELWFAKDLADEWVEVADPATAWSMFEQWMAWRQWQSRA